MRDLFRMIKRNLKFIIYHFFYQSTVKAYWYDNNHNFGDILNPILIHNLSNKNILWIDPELYQYKNYFTIGSILDKVNQYSIVWGTGFISQESKCNEKPLKVCAVRGPLTRQRLLELEIDCPEIYGDPALLLPYIYTPKTEKKYKLGIIPHYVDKNNLWLKQIKNPDVLILDIQRDSPFDFIDQLYSCEMIASSSLHGLIVADAYGIPSLWLEFSNKVVGKGFKFLDYFLSVGRADTEPFVIKEDSSLDEIMNSFTYYDIEIDLSKLLDACPFELIDRFSHNKVK